MAEINIERKKSHTGLWIAAVLVLFALGAWWATRSDMSGDSLVAGADSIAEGAAATVSEAAGALTDDSAGRARLPANVQRYLEWADERRADTTMNADHRYTANGIRQLAAALQDLATPGRNAQVTDELGRLRNRADTLEQNPSSAAHAGQVRAMFRSLGGLMAAMQQERFADLAEDVRAVTSAAESVRADRQLLEQRREVKAFFDRSATAVRRMAEQR